MVSLTMSFPKICASPPVGTVMPVRIRMVVVFPAPFGPRKPKVSPSLTEKEMSLRATSLPKCLVRCETSIAFIGTPV